MDLEMPERKSHWNQSDRHSSRDDQLHNSEDSDVFSKQKPPKLKNGTLKIRLRGAKYSNHDLSKLRGFDVLEFKGVGKPKFSYLKNTSSFMKMWSSNPLDQQIRELNSSWEIIKIKNLDFTNEEDSLNELIMITWESKVWRLIFDDCIIPEIIKKYSWHENKSTQRKLHLLGFVKWQFITTENKRKGIANNRCQSIVNICESLKTGKEATELAMLDLSDNDFTEKEVELICSDLAHIELICLEGNTTDVSGVECSNLIF